MQNEAAAFMAEIDETIIIAKNILSQVCSRCGDVMYLNDDSKKLEKTTELLRKLITEIAVTDYHDNAG